MVLHQRVHHAQHQHPSLHPLVVDRQKGFPLVHLSSVCFRCDTTYHTHSHALLVTTHNMHTRSFATHTHAHTHATYTQHTHNIHTHTHTTYTHIHTYTHTHTHTHTQHTLYDCTLVALLVIHYCMEYHSPKNILFLINASVYMVYSICAFTTIFLITSPDTKIGLLINSFFGLLNYSI